MRQILFRGKRSGEFLNGNWAYGSLLCYEPLSCNETERFYITDFGLMEQCSVAEKTIGQYTGLRDKSGAKIFEGDVIEFSICYSTGCYPHYEKKRSVVIFEDGCFYPFALDTEDFEVIGNVYDNPELIPSCQ